MTILDTIIERKKIEVIHDKRSTSIQQLEQSTYFNTPKISLKEYILKADKSGIIAEFKRQSPSKGIINNTATVPDVTTGYSTAGASALSVLTDTHFFGGTNDDVIAARHTNTIPILRKDFTIDEYQIIEAKAIGANAILLIASVLTKAEIKQFTTLAHNIGLEVLLEIHTEKELEKYDPAINIVGINNRNLNTFEVDFENAIRLAQKLPSHTVKIAESGISDYRSINYLKSHGFDGFLIGENFMKTASPGEACKTFIENINNSQHV
ncbi:MAG: indole-3-glycerol phosphate synthase TrpC [Flavobacteriaceae bacterium]